MADPVALATIEARLRQLLEADPVCQGQVSGTTIRVIAREFARAPEPDSDVLAERAACRRVMAAAAARFAELLPEDMLADPLIDLDAFRLELRRTDEVIASLGLGLHR